jgi:ABC-type transport system substrate-binding protein
MRLNHLGRGAVGTAAVAALALTACSGPSSSGADSKTRPSVLNVYLYQEPVGIFSPLAPSSGPDNQVQSFISQGLLGVDPTYHLQPELAQSYDVSSDAKTFTFHLRPGLKWSDGKPLTSKDVLFTYNALANPKTGSAAAGSFSAVQGESDVVAGKATSVSGFSTPDDTTFLIKATKPDFGLLAQIGTTFIIPQHVLGKDSPEQLGKDAFFRHPTVSSGPYKFVDYKTNQYVHVTANENFRTPSKIKNVYLKPMTSDVATAQLGNGGIDIASYSPSDSKTVAGFSNVTTQVKPGAGFVRIALNQSKAYFKDVRVRQAFLYAVDREQIVKAVLDGKGSVQHSAFYAENAPDNLNPYAYNPAKAKQLLQAAGWDSHRTIELEWVHGQRDRDETAQIIQSQLGAAGVKVKLVNIEAAQITDTYAKKSYDMVLFGGGNYAVDSSSVNVITACALQYPNGGNNEYFCDPKLDSLMAQANGTTDAAQRTELYHQAALEENSQADIMWLYDPSGLWGVNKRVHGFQAPGSQDASFWNPAGWSITS